MLIDLDKYKMKKNKQKFKKSVVVRSVCEKYKGKIQTVNKIKFKKNGSLLNLQSLNSSCKNKIFKTIKDGASKNGVTTANTKRNNNNIKDDRDRNFRSSNTNYT